MLITLLIILFKLILDNFNDEITIYAIELPNNKIKLTITILSILVVLSTILIKQHILIDVISAFILSIIIFIIVAKTNIALKTKKIIEKQ